MSRIEICPFDLVLTNRFIDMKYVMVMVEGLRGGIISPKNLTIPFITFKNGQWLVNDGNHTVKACQLVPLMKILADTY